MTTTPTAQVADTARLDVLEQAWRNAPYSRFTETFIAAARQYVTEPSETALATMRTEMQSRWGNLAPLVQHLAAYPKMPLGVLDLRLIDICVALDQTNLVLNVIAQTGPVSEVLAHLMDRGISEQDLVAMCFNSFGLVDRNWQPSALGQVMLSWLPRFEAEWLRAGKTTFSWGPSTALVALVLAAEPPRLDLARRLMRVMTPHASLAAQSVRLLLKADSAGFGAWAREAVLPPYPTGTRQGVLQVMRESAPDLAFEFACQVLREVPPEDESRETARRHAWERAQLRSVALDIAFARAPETFLATVEDVAITDEYWWIGRQAIKLLEKSSYSGASEALRRIVEKGGRQARIEALRTLLKSAWSGKEAYALALLGHHSKLLREEAMGWLEREGVDMIPTVTPLLDDTHMQVRLAAVGVLRHVGTPAAHAVLLARLAAEKQARVRRALLDALGMLEGAQRQVPPERITFLDDDAAGFQVASANLPLVWLGLDISTCPIPHWVTGTTVAPRTLAYLLHTQSQTTAPHPADVVRWSATLMQGRSAGDFALALFNQWVARGMRKDEAWCLPLVAALGDERLVPFFGKRIEDWGSQKADKALLAMAARLAQALTYMDCVAARDEAAALAGRRKRQGHKKVLGRIGKAVAESKRIADSWA